MRQCLYTSTINQQPPNVNLSLRLYPDPSSMTDHHPLAKLRLDTAWANQMSWNCARVANFCFEKGPTIDTGIRMKSWQNLWNEVQSWKRNRPRSFDPVWSGHSETSTFPEIFFTADWHGRVTNLFGVTSKRRANEIQLSPTASIILPVSCYSTTNLARNLRYEL